MLKVIKNAQLFSPHPEGKKDLLLCHNKIAAVANDCTISSSIGDIEVIDVAGKIVCPGLVDNHVIVQGGGGESGYLSRTPELDLEDAIQGGVTSMIGVRGTDGMARDLSNMLAKVKAINEFGISCWMLTGSYQMPVRTLTQSVSEDIMFIQEVIGVGEIAISDHRSSLPSQSEVASMIAECRVAGMLSGKAGAVKFHLGDAPEGIEMLQSILKDTPLPPEHYLPTHMNRNSKLFAQGKQFASSGGFLDFTTSSTPMYQKQGSIMASEALAICLRDEVPVSQITFSSDGQGSLPAFDEDGRLLGLTWATPRTLLSEIQSSVLEYKISLELALSVATSNPASLYKLQGKGSIELGNDADLIVLEPDTLTLTDMFSGGRQMLAAQKVIVNMPFREVQ